MKKKNTNSFQYLLACFSQLTGASESPWCDAGWACSVSRTTLPLFWEVPFKGLLDLCDSTGGRHSGQGVSAEGEKGEKKKRRRNRRTEQEQEQEREFTNENIAGLRTRCQTRPRSAWPWTLSGVEVARWIRAWGSGAHRLAFNSVLPISVWAVWVTSFTSASVP